MKIEIKDNYLWYGSKYITSSGYYGPSSLDELFKEVYGDYMKDLAPNHLSSYEKVFYPRFKK